MRQAQAATAKMSEDLADAAEHAGEAVKVGQCVAVEDNDPKAAARCHILQVVREVYILQDAHISPMFNHADGSAVEMPAGERVVEAYFFQPIGGTGLRYELWDEKWRSTGRFKKDFIVWPGCPKVIVPVGLIRHFGFQLTKQKGQRKSGDAYLLDECELDTITASLD